MLLAMLEKSLLAMFCSTHAMPFFTGVKYCRTANPLHTSEFSVLYKKLSVCLMANIFAKFGVDIETTMKSCSI